VAGRATPGAAPADPSTPDRYSVGTLRYTQAGLFLVFAWLLWGDFCYNLMEKVGTGSILPLFLLERLRASNKYVAWMLTSVPMIIGIVLGPVVSFKSDRCRSKWGRRIPYILFTLPFLCLFLVGLGFSEDMADWLRDSPLVKSAGIDPLTIALIYIGFMIVGFSCFYEFVGSVYWYLFADAVPKPFLGRFMAMFRIVGTLVGLMWNFWLVKYQLTHFRQIFLLAAGMYCVGFTLMCLFVKEGQYPPPEEIPKAKRAPLSARRAASVFWRFLAVLGGWCRDKWEPVKVYFRECFTHPLYVFLYLSTVLYAIAQTGSVGGVVFTLHVSQYQRALGGHTAAVTAVVMLPGGGRCLSAADDQTLKLWDTGTGSCLGTLKGHAGPVKCVGVAADGRTAVSAGADKTLKVWDVDSGACARTLEGHGGEVLAAAVTPDGKWALSGGGDADRGANLRLWNLETGTCVKTLDGGAGPIRSVALAADGARALSTDGDAVRLWDLATGRCLQTLQPAGEDDGKKPAAVNAVAFMPSLEKPAAPADERAFGQAPIDAVAGFFKELFSSGSLFDQPASSLPKVLAADAWAAAGGEDGLLRVWDLKTGREVAALKGHKGAIAAVQYKPDVKMVVTGSADKTVRVWNVVDYMETGNDQSVKSTAGYTDVIHAVAAADRGPLTVSGGADSQLHLWDVSAGISLAKSGAVAGVASLLVILLSYPFGWLVDKFHSLRVYVITKIVVIPLQVLCFLYIIDYFSYLTLEFAKCTVFTLMEVAALPLGMMLFPMDKYGQFASANGMSKSAGKLLGSVFGAGLLMDMLTHNGSLTDNYRYGYLWTASFYVLAAACLVVVYVYWKRLGGDKTYVPPEPYKHA
jgi:WD40 repeat protein